MKNTLCALFAFLCCQFIFAQQDEALLNLGVEARADYQREYIDGDAVKDNSGFKGKYLNIRIDGRLNDKFSYSYRQRLNKAHADQTFFDATDWLYLKYQATENWAFSAGKQVVAIGGYEYDRAPIDIFFGSEYWNNIPCYQLGVNAMYTLNDGADQLLAQVCQSPFNVYTTEEGNKISRDMYSLSLMWYGSHDWFNTIYSVNMIEYLPGEFINYITLGNKFNVGDFSLELDLMNRAVRNQTFLFKDFSVMGDLSYAPSDKFSLFVKATYDVNNSDKAGDYCVLPGTEVTRVGAGIEYYPLADKSVRLHAAFCRNIGSDKKAGVALLPEQSIASIGLKWKMNLLSLKK